MARGPEGLMARRPDGLMARCLDGQKTREANSVKPYFLVKYGARYVNVKKVG